MTKTTVAFPLSLARKIRERYGRFVSVSGFVREAVEEKLEREAATLTTTAPVTPPPQEKKEESVT